MAALPARIRFAAAALVLVGVAAVVIPTTVTTPVAAQQPASVDPQADAVKEQQLLDQLKQIEGRGTIPDTKSYVIEHPRGRDWRNFHEVTLRWIGGISILAMLALLFVFYLVRGPIRLQSGWSGRKILRFTSFERFIHWLTAGCFVVLALTGLNITFGKPLLLPLLGPEAFSAWSQWAKYAHNYVSFGFTIGVIVIFLMWIAGNIPNAVDIEWLKRGGGIIGHDHPPAYRFNAGQKAIYWIQVIAGTAMVVTGYLLMFPFYGTTINGMQTTEIAHGIIAMLFISVMIAHIYIGTIGMEGAFEGMGEGTVDLNWAKEHHSLWLEEEKRKGRTIAGPRAAAAPAE